MAGTIVLDGSVLIRVTNSAGDTLLDDIIALVEEAQMGKAPSNGKSTTLLLSSYLSSSFSPS